MPLHFPNERRIRINHAPMPISSPSFFQNQNDSRIRLNSAGSEYLRPLFGSCPHLPFGSAAALRQAAASEPRSDSKNLSIRPKKHLHAAGNSAACLIFSKQL